MLWTIDTCVPTKFRMTPNNQGYLGTPDLTLKIVILPDNIIRFYLEGPINTPPSVPPKVHSPGSQVPVERGITKEGVAYASLPSLGAQESCI